MTRTRQYPNSLCYYDHAVTDLMMEKYGFDRMQALRLFLCSETHALLEYQDYGMSSFGSHGIFEIWECEMITGDPRNSVYIRCI